MKRLIAAIAILVILVSLCLTSNIITKNTCDKLIADVDAFYNQKILSDTLQHNWQRYKENLSIFVNHQFLDDITIYVGQLTISDNDINSPEFTTVRKNILTTVSMIKTEQQFGAHSFY